jgi:hypothetical protein
MGRVSAFISCPLSKRGNAGVALLAAGEGRDECVDLLLIRTLAAGVDARTSGVTDPQYDLVRPRRVVDQHRGRIKGIEIPSNAVGTDLGWYRAITGRPKKQLANASPNWPGSSPE